MGKRKTSLGTWIMAGIALLLVIAAIISTQPISHDEKLKAPEASR